MFIRLTILRDIWTKLCPKVYPNYFARNSTQTSSRQPLTCSEVRVVGFTVNLRWNTIIKALLLCFLLRMYWFNVMNGYLYLFYFYYMLTLIKVSWLVLYIDNKINVYTDTYIYVNFPGSCNQKSYSINSTPNLKTVHRNIQGNNRTSISLANR